MSSQQCKTCKGCHVLRNYKEFLNEKGVILKKCLQCRNKIKITRSNKNKPQSDTIISHLDITETIYNSLTSINNINEFYEGDEELNLTFSIENLERL